jgi:hypothetical protein
LLCSSRFFRLGELPKNLNIKYNPASKITIPIIALNKAIPLLWLLNEILYLFLANSNNFLEKSHKKSVPNYGLSPMFQRGKVVSFFFVLFIGFILCPLGFYNNL